MFFKIYYTNRFGSAERRREDGEVSKLHQSEKRIKAIIILSEWGRILYSLLMSYKARALTIPLLSFVSNDRLHSG